MAKLASPAGRDGAVALWQCLHNIFTIFSQHFHNIFIDFFTIFQNIFKLQCWPLQLGRRCCTLAMPSQYFHNIFTKFHSIFIKFSQYFHKYFTIFHNIFKWQSWPFQLVRSRCTLAMPSQYCSFALNINLHCTICT